MDDYGSPSDSSTQRGVPGAAYLREAVSSESVDYGDAEPQYFCKFTFGQFFTLTVLLVVTFCGTFYLGAKYGNQYLRINDAPAPTVAALNTFTAGNGVAMQIPESVKQDKELKQLARQALAKMQTERLEQQVRTAIGEGTLPANATMAQPMAPANPALARTSELTIESLQARGANEEGDGSDAAEALVNGVPVGDVAGTDPTRLPRANGAVAASQTDPALGGAPANAPQVSPELLAAAQKAGIDVDALKQQYMNNELKAEKTASITLPADGAKSKVKSTSVSAETPPALQPATAAGANDAVTKLQGASGLPYSVQLGAYRNAKEAKAKVDEWKTRGYPAYVLESQLPEKGTYYRVRVGAFATRGEASQYLTGLQSNESADGMVVQSE